jgi:hypothetical protein
MKILTTIRNNLKKSIAGFSILAYGTYYLYERKETNRIYQAYCIEADKYGKQKLNVSQKLPRITVFLNPVSNNDQSKVLYDKYAAPLLHLSGLDVRLVRLDAKNEITDLMQLIDDSQTDCIVIAGGNRTLIECLTSLLKRNDDLLKRIKIGAIPLGENNSLIEKLFKIKSTKNQVKTIGDACLSVIKGDSEKLSVFKIDFVDNDEANTEIYAFSNVSCGFEADSSANKENYWAFGPFKNYINQYFKLRNAYHKPNQFNLTYKNYCNGCKSCFYAKENLVDTSKIPKIEPKNLAQLFFKKFIADNRSQVQVEKKRSKYPINPDCDVEHEMTVGQSQIDVDINDSNGSGMNANVKQLKKNKLIDEFKMNLNEISFNKPKNATKICIDNEFYDLKNAEKVSIQYLHNHIDFLFDSNHRLFALDQTEQDNFNLSQYTLDSYIQINSSADLIQPFKRAYEYYLKI